MGKKVLIVDDEPNIVVSLDFLMRQSGFEVLIARTGEEAIDIVRSQRPDLALLDIMLPGKSGFDVCQEIRADERLRDMKIILLTAKGRDVDVTKGLALGADAYVTKPFSTREVSRKVAEMLAEPA